MPAANLMATDVNAVPKRVPKLAVHNRVSSEDVVPDVTTLSWPITESGSRPASSTHLSERTISPTLERRQSDQSQEDSLEQLRQRGRKDDLQERKADEGKKKKSSGMLRFLKMKEPSASAWEEFAEMQKKTAAQKGARTSTVGMPGVSSQRLPDYVPKTNSKWDGLPDNAKRQRMDRKSKDRGNRISTFSTSTVQTDRSGLSAYSDGSGERSPARRFGSLSSNPSRPQSVLQSKSNRASVQSRSSLDEPRRVAYRSPKITAIHPALRETAVTPWDEPPELSQGTETKPQRSPQTFLYPPSPPPGVAELPGTYSLPPTPELEIPRLEDDTAFDFTTGSEASPETPPVVDTHTPLAQNVEQYRYIQLGDQHSEAQGGGTFWHSDTDNEDTAVTSARSDAPKGLSNFSRPRVKGSVSSTTDDGFSTEPTIDEEDEASDTFQPTLRDEQGRTFPFRFEQSTPHLWHASPTSRAALSTVPARTCSTSSRFTSITTTTTTTVTQSLRSPTFSEVPSQSTRPSTAASTFTTGTAYRRPSLSPIRSNSDTASVAPSEMSVQWTMSPKERLGLGGKVTRREQAEVLPWEIDEPPRSETSSSAAIRRLSGAGQAAQEAGKLKRLSMRLGKK